MSANAFCNNCHNAIKQQQQQNTAINNARQMQTLDDKMLTVYYKVANEQSTSATMHATHNAT